MIASLLLAFLASSPAAAAEPAERVRIEQVIRTLVEAQDGKDMSMLRASTWPDGHFSVASFAPGSVVTRRPWGQVLFGGVGVNYRSRLTHLGMRIREERATAWVHQLSEIYYGADFSGRRIVAHNLVSLERRSGEWRVLNWSRRVRELGSNTPMRSGAR